MIIRFEKLRNDEKFVRLNANGTPDKEIYYKYGTNKAIDTAGNMTEISNIEQVFKLKKIKNIEEKRSESYFSGQNR